MIEQMIYELWLNEQSDTTRLWISRKKKKTTMWNVWSWLFLKTGTRTITITIIIYSNLIETHLEKRRRRNHITVSTSPTSSKLMASLPSNTTTEVKVTLLAKLVRMISMRKSTNHLWESNQFDNQQGNGERIQNRNK